MRTAVLAISAAAMVLWCVPARADETSATDKLRILYSTRFTFTDDGLPLVTVEIMGGKKDVHLHAKGGMLRAARRCRRQHGRVRRRRRVDDHGRGRQAGGASRTGPSSRRSAPTTRPASRRALARWKDRGFEPRAFEVGTVFGTGGEVIDTRETRIAIDPVAAGKGAARARRVAKRFGVATSVHEELVRRPSGTIVAQRGGTVDPQPVGAVVRAEARDRDAHRRRRADATPAARSSTPAPRTAATGASVYVTLDHDGSLVAANAVAEDKLLAGLVPAEMYPDAPAAALEAQAIAARTELLQKIGRRNLTDPFLLCSTQQCQVYAGAGKEDPRATRARSSKTRGIVLLRDGGGLVDVRYSASCGGHTEDNEAIWGGEADPSLRGRADDAKARHHAHHRRQPRRVPRRRTGDEWCGKVKGKAAAQQVPLDRAHRGADDLTLRVADRVSRDRARQEPRREAARRRAGASRLLAIVGDKATVEVTGDLHIRRLLGGLKSTLFAIARDGDTFVFRGAGFGHGVGMCQMGAIGMAEAGRAHAEILEALLPRHAPAPAVLARAPRASGAASRAAARACRRSPSRAPARGRAGGAAG